MMKNIIKYTPWIVIAAMLLLLIPGLGVRVNNESKNDNVTISLLYNDVKTKLSSKNLDKFLDECKEIGIDTVSVMEDDLNSLTQKGEVTSIKYNVLCHKYDDESMRVAEAIEQKLPNTSYDSHVVLVKRPKAKEKLAGMIPKKFTAAEYGYIKDVENMDIYVFYNGRKEQWDYAFGYDEKEIQFLYDKGFKIALVHKVKNYEKTEYLKDIENIVKKYDVKYMNLKKDSKELDGKKLNKDNYLGLSDIINKNGMTLVVTENTDQLSNQKFLGYSEVFARTMSPKGTNKVVRSYETYDDSQADGKEYKYRVSQLFNSTVDRNLHFITLTQISLENVSYEDCADLTLMAASEYKSKIEKLGYTVNGETEAFDYNVSKPFNYGLCAAVMVMCALLMLELVFGIKSMILTIISVVLAFLAIAISLVMPAGLLSLYPTLYSVVQSCFVMTIILAFVKHALPKMPFILLAISTLAVAVGSLIFMSTGLSVMLSGIDYYINNDIFRGIKLSLLVPVVYTMFAYYFMFIKNERDSVLKTTAKVLCSDIKVYWLIIAAVIGGVGVYYIIRSGNVNKISSFESAMRNAVTEIFPARPRTKEFLIGYPSLVLFVYYIKHYDIKLLNWILAVGTSILAASVTNSFCHVFTDFNTILMRVVNGLTVGIIISILIYIANLILVKIAKAVMKRI